MTSVASAPCGPHAPFLLGALPLLTQRLALKRQHRAGAGAGAGRALGALSLGAAFALGTGEAFAAAPKTVKHDGASFFNVGDLDAQKLESGAMEVTFDSGVTLVVPSGEYGFHDGTLYIAESHLPYELAHAMMTPEQVEGYVYAKTDSADDQAAIPTLQPMPFGYGQSPYVTMLVSAGAAVLAGAAVWYLLSKVGDAPDFEYPIYSVNFEENGTDAAYTALAKDLDSTDLTYSLREGAAYDDEFFSIDESTGEISFITPPNYEAPVDDDLDNVYDIKVDATDEDGGVGTMLLHVTVTDQAPDTLETTLSNVDDTLAFAGSAYGDDLLLTDTARSFDIDLSTGQDYALLTGALDGATLDMGSDNDTFVQNTALATTGTVEAGAGDDRLVFAADLEDTSVMVYNLGTGADTLVFTSATFEATTTPVFQLFTSDDRIDLSALDLSDIDATNYNNQALAEAALGANDIAFATVGSDTILLVDSNDDGTSDITIELESQDAFDTVTILL